MDLEETKHILELLNSIWNSSRKITHELAETWSQHLCDYDSVEVAKAIDHLAHLPRKNYIPTLPELLAVLKDRKATRVKAERAQSLANSSLGDSVERSRADRYFQKLRAMMEISNSTNELKEDMRAKNKSEDEILIAVWEEAEKLRAEIDSRFPDLPCTKPARRPIVEDDSEIDMKGAGMEVYDYDMGEGEGLGIAIRANRKMREVLNAFYAKSGIHPHYSPNGSYRYKK